jgi:predicted DNA-binding transcriptional regulator AlpA
MTRRVTEWPRELTTRPPHPQQRLEQALKNYQHDLEGLQSALLGFKEALLEFEEGALNDEQSASQSASQHQQNDQNLRLLSVAEVCLRLGSDKSSVYQKLRSGEIPSLTLPSPTSGLTTKVRQRDLEEYIRGQRRQRRHRTLVGENGSTHWW